jgi:hypothetical protein
MIYCEDLVVAVSKVESKLVCAWYSSSSPTSDNGIELLRDICGIMLWKTIEILIRVG